MGADFLKAYLQERDKVVRAQALRDAATTLTTVSKNKSQIARMFLDEVAVLETPPAFPIGAQDPAATVG